MGEKIKEEFNKGDEKAKSGSDYFFYVYNSKEQYVKVSVNVEKGKESYRVDVD